MPKLFTLLLPALSAAAGNESGKYMGGALMVFIVLALLSQIPYSRLEKKIKNVKREKTPPVVRNELDYADYMQWAVKNDYAAYFNKRSINSNITEDDA